ncbi:TPA: hypothetical protein H1005_00630 [archaeon]|uniref:Uncharacterized protein n=1 Tax=Candidatus Naiadarchaeum limnaeum TaxID=2756139 RepID=A0A832XGX9_9ARCH|nr:hypothetical protein [Candidatus Naiadarchaeales archaeon SRR2090153.bin1042]HIK00714.1 hypothetical protein [Candidatus Naiadarchaeum limnaeum]
MAIDPDVQHAYEELKNDANVLGKKVFALAEKVKNTSDHKFARAREDIREQIYGLRRKVQQVKGIIKGEMGKIAKTQPIVQAFVSAITTKESAIARLQQEEINLIRAGAAAAQIEEVSNKLMTLRHALTQEELEKERLIQKYSEGEKSNDDIKELAGWSKKLDHIDDALSKISSNLGI